MTSLSRFLYVAGVAEVTGVAEAVTVVETVGVADAASVAIQISDLAGFFPEYGKICRFMQILIGDFLLLRVKSPFYFRFNRKSWIVMA